MLLNLVSVEFKKTVNDGSYGNESATCHVTAEVEEGEDSATVAVALAQLVRAQVMAQLAASNNRTVRRNANPLPHVCTHCKEPLGDWDMYEHKACADKARAERDEQRELRDEERQVASAARRGDEDDVGDIPF